MYMYGYMYLRFRKCMFECMENICLYVCMYVIVVTPRHGCYSSGTRVGVLHLWYQSGDRFLAGLELA